MNRRSFLDPRCREFISQLSLRNLDAEVLVNEADVVRLRDLLPYRWPQA